MADAYACLKLTYKPINAIEQDVKSKFSSSKTSITAGNTGKEIRL